MPTVYKDRLNIAGMNARLNVRTSGDDFGAIEAGSIREAAQAKGQQAQADQTLARGLLDLGSAAFKIDERLDEANANELDARYTEFERSMLHDPKNGYYAKQGKDALDGRAPLEKSIREQIGTIAKDARSPRARAAFYQLAQRRAGDTFTRADAYAQDQLKVYENTTDEAKIAEAINNAALQYNDPNAFKANIDTVIGTSTRMARRLGLSGDAERNYVQTKQSSAYGTSIIAMAADNPEKADALFKEVRGGMTVGDATRVENALRPAVLDAKARVGVDALWNNPDYIGADGKPDYGKVTDAIMEEKDTALRDAKLSEADSRFARMTKATNIAEAAGLDAVYKGLNNGVPLSRLRASVPGLSEKTWYDLSEDVRRRNKAIVDGVEQQQSKVSEIRKGDLMTFATDPRTQAMFVKGDWLDKKIVEYGLTDKDAVFLRQKRADILAGADANTALVTSTLKDARDIAEPIVGKYGIDLTPSAKDKNKNASAAFNASLLREVELFTEEQKRAPNPKEIQDIISRSILRSGDAFKGIGDYKPAGNWNTKPSTAAVIPWDDIPSGDREAVRQYLVKQNPGKKISKGDVQNEYSARMAGRK